MAKKHFDNYFNIIYSQYLQLQAALQAMSKEVEENIVPPERIEELKKTIQPVKTAYETLLYVKYLLDMPARKQKKARYDKTMQKVIAKTGEHNGDATIKRNKETIDSLTL